MKILLEEKEMSEAIDEKGWDLNDKDSIAKDNKAKSLIVSCVSDCHIDILRKCKTAREMIVKLESVFERKSIFNKLYLRKKLLSLKCNSKKTMQEHFNDFDKIINDLEAAGCKIEESDKVCHLLLTLPKEYDTVITTIETMSNEKEIDIEFVKSRLLDSELKFNDGKTTESNNSTNNDVENSFLTCFRCNKQGHKAFQCDNNKQARGRYTRPYRGQTRQNYRGRGRGRPSANLTEEKENLFVAFSTEANIIQNETDNELVFVVDSGATHHFIQQKYEKYMTEIENLDREICIKIANGDMLKATKKGILKTKYNERLLKIEGLIVPNLTHNLLSVNRLMERNYDVTFTKGQLKISKNGINFYGQKNGKLHVLNVSLDLTEQCHSAINDDNVWHKRLAHLNRKSLSMMKLPFSEKCCNECLKNKSTRLPFKPVLHRQSKQIGELIHSDVAGPMKQETKEGSRYFQTIIDDFSHFTQTYLLKNKSEAAQNLIDYVNELERERDLRVKRIRCDNGGEYSSNDLKKFCKKKGINIEYSLPYSPQMNGKSERMNRSLLDKARTILNESELPRHLWGQAVLTATYLLNRCPSKSINFEIPAKIFDREFILTKLRVFGCKAWAIILPRRDKFSERAISGRMVGYAKNGYKIWDPKTDTVIVSRDVRFDETNNKYQDDTETTCEGNYYYDQRYETKEEYDTKVKQDNEKDTENLNNIDEQEKTRERATEVKSRTGRAIKTPSYLNEYELHQAYCLLNVEEPENYDGAMKTGWKEAIENEIKALEKMNTFTETELPDNGEIIDAKWIFKVKENGQKKARLVARGYQIKKNEEFGKNYAPVARMSTVRTLLAEAVQKDWSIRQLDVPTAFLNGKLESEIYLKPPEGIKVSLNKVLKLNRGLYGLRESPKVWNQRFNEYMERKGFTRSKHDFCLYFSKEISVILLIYVDDILITGVKDNIETIVQGLKEEFEVKDFGFPKTFLGMEIEKLENGIKIKQKRQINKMLEKFGMKECKGVTTPIVKGYQLDQSEPVTTEVPYRQLIGALMFVATVSRPDICYATSYLSQYLDKPTQSLWTQAKRTLRYLKQTADVGLLYVKNEDVSLHTYSDADWAGDSNDRKSMSGSVTLYCNKAVAWFSRKQNCIALSTVEAEYIAGATSACDLLYMKGLYQDISGPECEVKCVLLIDNKGAIQLSKSLENSKRTKHIDIKFHFLKDLTDKKEIDIEYVSTDCNLSDMMTKSLSNEKLLTMKKCLNIV